MDNARLSFLFRRYLKGGCSPQEEAELLEYLTGSESEQASRLLEELWNRPEHRLADEKAEAILRRILPIEKEVIPMATRNFPWIRIAASIAVVASAGIFYLQPSSVETLLPPEPIAKETSTHQFIKLPDGSTVLLNNGSTLDYPEAFDGDTREVVLSGEAFFDIAHNPEQPFIVHTGTLSTTVLGTAFNVRAYDNDDNITVTVKRGRVSVSAEETVLGIINPDQQITFSRATMKSEQKEVKSEEVIAWAEKDIFFDDVTLSEAVHTLRERFGVTIDFETNAMGDCRFTATFVRGEDLFQILDVICAFNATTYTADESGLIRIEGTGCDPAKNETKIQTQPKPKP